MRLSSLCPDGFAKLKPPSAVDTERFARVVTAGAEEVCPVGDTSPPPLWLRVPFGGRMADANLDTIIASDNVSNSNRLLDAFLDENHQLKSSLQLVSFRAGQMV